MKTCICDRTEIMWNTERVGVTADNIDRFTASSLTVLWHSVCKVSSFKSSGCWEETFYYGDIIAHNQFQNYY